jgi:sugar-specific transcriptional regulator TrmB
MYQEHLEQLGLYKNEARIYESLLKHGELSVGQISVNSGVNRRNVYDSINRLIEKGLVFEILEKKENHYKAVEPRKLLELVKEKEALLENILPNLEKLYSGQVHKDEVYIYKGPEAWKNYMRDILRVGEDFYCIGGKGAWMDEKNKHFFPQFIKEVQRKNIKMHHLFDFEVRNKNLAILKYVGKDYKFLPEGYSAPASVDIFGDHVNIVSGIKLGGMEEQHSLTVIVNRQIANAFRLWFKFMWDFCPKEK